MPTGDCSHSDSVSEQLSEPSGVGKLPELSEEAGKRKDSPAFRHRGPLSSLCSPSPQNPGRATLAEAKFTFLHGA
jgi:hypothetical protein